MSKSKSNAAVVKETPASKVLVGIKVDKVKEVLVDKFIRSLKGVKFDVKESSIEEKLTFVQGYNRTNVEKAKLVQCLVCGVMSSADSEACPACGDDGSDEEPEETAVEAPEPEEEELEEDEEEEEEEIDTAPEPVTAVKQKAKPVAQQKPKMELVKPVKAATESRLSVASTTELDDAVARIQSLKGAAARNHWELGREIKKVHEGQMWKQRADKAGKPIFKSFDQWATREIGFSHVMTYQLMDVATSYSEELIGKVGVTKLAIVLSAPPDVRDELMEDVEKGMGVRGIRNKAAEARRQERKKTGASIQKKTGAAIQKEGRKKMPLGGGRNTAGSRMTVATVEGIKKIPFYKRPAKGEEPTERVQRLGEEIVALEELTNGVIRTYSLAKGAAGWMLRVETRRPKD